MSEEENSRWKQIDDEILDYELKELMVGEKNRAAKPLSSIPDVTERNWNEVSSEFLSLAEKLLAEIEE